MKIKTRSELLISNDTIERYIATNNFTILDEKWVSVDSLQLFISNLQKGLYKNQKIEVKLERLLEELEKEE